MLDCLVKFLYRFSALLLRAIVLEAQTHNLRGELASTSIGGRSWRKVTLPIVLPRDASNVHMFEQHGRCDLETSTVKS
jgi:hypothetical protein